MPNIHHWGVLAIDHQKAVLIQSREHFFSIKKRPRPPCLHFGKQKHLHPVILNILSPTEKGQK